MRDVDVIAEAFPRSPEGRLLCAHCRGPRPGFYLVCAECWNALSAFVQLEIVRPGRTRLEKAQLILDSRPRMP